MTKNDLTAISNILEEYSLEVQEGITKAAEDISKQGAKELKANSPKRTGKYSRGWKVEVKKGFGYVNTTIYNSTDWQLTHLLEKPHLLRNGKKSKPIVHIQPVEEKCIKNFEKKVEQIIKNGG